jgi:hypothetical protein
MSGRIRFLWAGLLVAATTAALHGSPSSCRLALGVRVPPAAPRGHYAR